MGFLNPETSDGRVVFLLPWEGNVLLSQLGQHRGGGEGAQKPAKLTVDFSVKIKGCSPSACNYLGNIFSEILSRLMLV